MNRINVCLSTDDNYVKYASNVILSALSNKNPDDEYKFYILHSSLSDESKKILESYDGVELCPVDSANYAPYFNNSACPHVALPTLYRLSLPSILSEVDRVLYLDCDLIVLKSLAEFFSTELLENQYAACVPDSCYKGHMKRMGMEDNGINFYFNAGVCLFDLAKMRRDNIEEKLFDYLKSNFKNLLFSDQDVLNDVLKGRVKQMDEKYNFISPNFYFSNEKDVVIAHFAGIKPWQIGFYNVYRELFWKYLSMTELGKTKELQAQKRKVLFMHRWFCQILWHIKMYPLFFFRKRRLNDFMRIVKKSEY